ncbi:MAG: TRAP transporter substrate-binding protein [Firmicutes bacterium]|nr:TRAP transporter substrate-binding protein [Bacillota bacterium]
MRVLDHAKKNSIWLRLTVSVVLAVMLLSTAGCSGSGGQPAKPSGDQGKKNVADGPKYIFKVGHAMPDKHHYQLGLAKFAQLAQEKSKGQIKIEIFPSAQLGGTRDRTEGVKLGTADMEFVGSPDLARWVPQFFLFDLPFFIDSPEKADKIMDGPVGEELRKKAAAAGFELLGFGENGFRNVFNKVRPVNKVADLRGLKLRVYPNKLYVESFTAMGAMPATTDWGELFTALTQGTVDGAEAAEAHFMTGKFYEAGQKYFSLTRHMYIPALLIMNKGKFNGLPADLQQALRDSAREAMAYQRQLSRQQAKDFLQQMPSKGVTVNEVADKSTFIEPTKLLYEKWTPTIGADLVEMARKSLQ